MKKFFRMATFMFVMLICITCNSNLSAENASKSKEIKTLVIVSHNYPDQSVLTKGLEEAARNVKGVEVRNLEKIYGFDTQAINGAEERKIAREYDRMVFIFPTHWFNITPMMKAYLDNTWGSTGPDLWAGKEMLVVSVAGGGKSVYGKNGKVGVELEDVFLSMKASALYAGMTYLKPLVFESATRSDLKKYQEQLIERLKK